MRRQIDPVDSFDLVRAISELGYKVKTQKVIFPVHGMSSASCVNRIKATFRMLSFPESWPGIMATSVEMAKPGSVSTSILIKRKISDYRSNL